MTTDTTAKLMKWPSLMRIGEILTAISIVPFSLLGIVFSSKILRSALRTNYIVERGIVYSKETQRRMFRFVASFHVFLISLWAFCIFASIWVLIKEMYRV